MHFKQLSQIFLFTMILTFFSCLGENSWEDLESDYDHVLNVFGLISLDFNQTSYIGIYRTTDLDEVSQNFVSVDTVGWCNCDDDECSWIEECDDKEQEGFWIYDSIFEPAALIKDASVTISDDNGNLYDFDFVDNISFIDTVYYDTSGYYYGYPFSFDTTYYDTNIYRINLYVDTTGAFNPQAGTNYQLNISTPNYNTVIGYLTTPNIPTLDSLVQQGRVIDTVLVNEPFDIYWTSFQGGKGLVTGEVDLGNWWEDSLSRDWCGGYFDPFVIDLSNDQINSYTVYPWLCTENLEQEDEAKDYFIRLTAMDDNYYEYFVVGEAGEYSNALLNYPTTKGRSVGIEGGFGFFGSIASDRMLLKITR